MSDTFVDTQQDVDDPQLDPNAGDDNDPDAGGVDVKPFLKVNDRQVYKTKADVIKSMEEASKLGASFGELRKVAKEFGIQNLEPGLVRQLFSELVTHREKAKSTAKPTNPTGSSGEGKNVDPKVEEAKKWLKEQAGVVTKEEYEAVLEKLKQLEGGMSAREQESRDSLISEGQEAVTGWLAGAKGADGKPVSLDEDQRNELEETIAAWVNAKQERIDKFYRGGNTSLNLVKEGFTKALPIVIAGAVAFPNSSSRVAANGKTKAELMQRNPRRMPQDGGGNDDGRGRKRSERLGDPSLHNRVKNKLARLLAGDNDE